MKVTEIAKKIDKLFTKHLYGELGDYRIFYRDKAIDVNTSTGRKIMEDVKASDWVEYSNDKGVTVTFDGYIYELMNYGFHMEPDESLGILEKHDWNLVDELNKLLEKYNCWYENGHAWNFSVYEN